jgi:hypothetical protein
MKNVVPTAKELATHQAAQRGHILPLDDDPVWTISVPVWLLLLAACAAFWGAVWVVGHI